MRVIYISTTLAVLLLSSGGFLFWRDYTASHKIETYPQQAVNEIKTTFEARRKPLFTINTEELRQSKESQELIDPALALPHTQKYPYKEIASLFHYANTCENLNSVSLQNSDLKKTLVWHEFICGRRTTLQDSFFSKKPFMHPSGESFVALAAKTSKPPFNSPAWVSAHIRYAHILENPCGQNQDCQRLLVLNRVSTAFTSEKLMSLLNGDPVVETASYIFLLHRSENAASSSMAYLAFSRDSWDNFIGNQLLNIRKGTSPNCILQEGSLCWVKNNKRSAKENFRLVLIFIMGLLVLVTTLLWQIIKRHISQRRAATQRTFVLQMLTHEIRTPATGLKLSLETLRREFDSLPSDSQKAFLRICDQTQRLVTVIEASKQYLTYDSGPHGVKFKTQPIVSLNSFVETIVEKYGSKINLKLLPEDKGAKFDRYWIELCLHNLIDNALAHGKPPINVTLSYAHNNLIFDVQDGGTLNTNSLDDLAVPFQKGASSRGLGLGLVLVRKITEAMGGELVMTNAPTTFSIKMRDLV